MGELNGWSVDGLWPVGRCQCREVVAQRARHANDGHRCPSLGARVRECLLLTKERSPPEGDVHFTTIGETVSIVTKVIQKAGATELHASEEYSARWPGKVRAALRIWQHVDLPVATQRNSQELAATAIMQQMAEKVEKGKMWKNKRGEEHGQLQARSKWGGGGGGGEG